MIRIVDASVVVKWLVPEDGTDQAAEVMRQPLIAPETLVPEVLAALRKRVQRGLMHKEDAHDAALMLTLAGITFEPVQPLAQDILALSLRLSLSTYDCAYLAVARRREGVLVTADMRLVRRCGQADAAGLGLQVASLGESDPQVRERPVRAYISRRRAA